MLAQCSVRSVAASCQIPMSAYASQRTSRIKEKMMPIVGKKKFPYTKAGKKDAKEAKEYEKKTKKKAKKKTKKKTKKKA